MILELATIDIKPGTNADFAKVTSRYHSLSSLFMIHS